ncbi:elongation factor P 5-aminopentanone reductase [Heyndrickxia ginsengihumi]|uniref:3-ketoacyl-ACP reductase n=1 Tax=Heyndrickxia ginsengihumi TaxID=363870 RepID=A0A0A6VIV0_9BACI|nr:SDR family oxidoreductase [Heyndrickxia ginsengihumi]KHD86559.1 3-ketoacyl-ACP reductase [Heyndrickxia ginsengihumi]MBE6182819.1 SDR family oxidoreductase [Bacillus sp. (in: firmicutes)]MCM3022559.1 SDR family oxidoreductase [Heyndrickxia ginsengihumi]NEY21210.1 SDR family oxidoreductase [Heyndrickxia ginsengihumi]
MKKFALITGASGGIGKETAKVLAAEGWNLYVHYYRNKDGIIQLIKELSQYPIEIIPIQANLMTKQGISELVNNIFHLDAICYTSGTSHYGLLLDTEEQTMDEMYQIHVKAPMMLSKLLLPKLTQNKVSYIVVVSSIWGQTGAACEVVYSAMKGAQISFVKALSKEMARSGVLINAVAPGAVDTNMLQLFTAEEIADLKDEIPIGRIASPKEVAGTIAYLLSERASYITGQTISINGAWYT